MWGFAVDSFHDHTQNSIPEDRSQLLVQDFEVVVRKPTFSCCTKLHK